MKVGRPNRSHKFDEKGKKRRYVKISGRFLKRVTGLLAERAKRGSRKSRRPFILPKV